MSVLESNGRACETRESQRVFMKTILRKNLTKLLFEIYVDDIPKLIR
jgi:hypothetical protein